MLHWFARSSKRTPFFRGLVSASIIAGSLLSPLSQPSVLAAEVPAVDCASDGLLACPVADAGPPAVSETPFTLSIQASAAPVRAPVAVVQDGPSVGGLRLAADSPAPRVAIMPQKQTVAAQAQAAQAPMTWHGGPVERDTSVNFTIFWQPPGTVMSANYQSLINRYFQDIGGSSMYGLLTQYSDAGGQIANSSSLGATWVDTTAYPSNPLTDLDLQNSVVRAINTNHWDFKNVNANFVVYTALGEVSCASPGVCSSNVFCGYHTYFVGHVGTTNYNVKYMNIPYGGNDPIGCGTPTSPNNDAAADAAINVTSHEHMETATDPILTGWYETNLSGEIGDKCAFVYGGVDGQGANVTLNGHPYIVQKEWSNTGLTCALSLPLPTFTLSVGKAGSGSGTVTSNPIGISCGVTCSAPFTSGASVVLTAIPTSGSVFAGWSGACSGTGSCAVTMDAAHSVTATFAGAPVCSPRPNVHVSASPASPGVLQVTVSTSGSNVALQSIQFNSAVNGMITGGGLVNSSGSTVLSLSGTSFTFTVRRVTAGMATTVPFVVNDSCGAWPTFVGGGPNAF
jgi:hypothetical protein